MTIFAYQDVWLKVFELLNHSKTNQIKMNMQALACFYSKLHEHIEIINLNTTKYKLFVHNHLVRSREAFVVAAVGGQCTGDSRSDNQG